MASPPTNEITAPATVTLSANVTDLLSSSYSVSFFAGPALLGTTAKRPFGLYVHGRYDTAGAVRSVLGIVGALRWRQSADVLEVLGDVTQNDLDSAYNLGGTIAAGLT